MSAPSSLSREVLKWIQSLDLAYSVRNVRRDFSNGFLVAEIFSRYYERDITMHSYDNGNSLKKKRGNWELLMRFFKRQDIPISWGELEDLMHCKAGAAVPFINKVYTILTQRRVQDVMAPMEEDDDVPAFAKPTASAVIKDTLKQPDMLKTLDTATMERRLRATLDKHEAELQKEKAMDPDRFTGTASLRKTKVMRGPTRTVGSEDPTATITFKEVQVKPIERSIAHIRASKDAVASGGGGGGGGGAGAGGGAAGRSSSLLGDDASGSRAGSRSSRGGGGMSGDDGAASVSMLTDVLNRAVSDALAGEELLHALDPRKGAADAFAEAVRQLPDLAEEVVAAPIEVAGDSVEALSRASLASPRAFWRLAGWAAAPLTACAADSAGFAAAVTLLRRCGERMAAAASGEALQLFVDYALPKLAPLLKAQPRKRAALMTLPPAFAAPDGDARVLSAKALSEALADSTAFTHCLAMAVDSERDWSEPLLKMYAYYATQAVHASSPSTRAAGVIMLASIVRARADSEALTIVDEVLPALVSDVWWEVQAAVLVCAAAIIAACPADCPQVERAVAAIDRLLQPACAPAVATVGLSVVAPLLHSTPALLTAFCDVLLSAPPAVRRPLLRTPAEPAVAVGRDSPTAAAAATRDSAAAAGGGAARPLQPVRLLGGVMIAVSPVCDSWDGVSVVEFMLADLEDSKRDSLEVEDAELLHAAIVNGDFEEEASLQRWLDLFLRVKEFLFVSCCDADLCHLSLAAINKYLQQSPLAEQILKEATLLGCLRLLYPEDGAGDETCGMQVAQFLQDTYDCGAPLAAGVHALLLAFASNYPTQLPGSALQPVLQYIERREA